MLDNLLRGPVVGNQRCRCWSATGPPNEGGSVAWKDISFVSEEKVGMVWRVELVLAA